MARRLVQAGHEVEWFAASFPEAAPSEVIDGVRLVRRGHQWSVHLRAWRHYRGTLPGHFDLVIDQVNTIPFLTPLWAGIPVFMMIWQLAREVWWYESPFPLNAIGYALESLYLRPYRRTAVLTFSNSTASDLRAMRFAGNVTVVPVGIAPPAAVHLDKSDPPCFIYVGRLAPSKRLDHIISAFARFRQVYGSGMLHLIGSGPVSYVSKLRRLTARLGVERSVEFSGWLDGQRKWELMYEAAALIMASAREGWGLVVTECNACGTPAVVYDVPGLRDSVRHLETGLLVRPTPESLADGMVRVVRDVALYERLRLNALEWSRSFTYEESFAVISLALGASLTRTDARQGA